MGITAITDYYLDSFLKFKVGPGPGVNQHWGLFSRVNLTKLRKAGPPLEDSAGAWQLMCDKLCIAIYSQQVVYNSLFTHTVCIIYCCYIVVTMVTIIFVDRLIRRSVGNALGLQQGDRAPLPHSNKTSEGELRVCFLIFLPLLFPFLRRLLRKRIRATHVKKK